MSVLAEILQNCFIALIFHKQEISFWIFLQYLNSLFCHLHNGWITRAISENLKSHVFGLKQT